MAHFFSAEKARPLVCKSHIINNMSVLAIKKPSNLGSQGDKEEIFIRKQHSICRRGVSHSYTNHQNTPDTKSKELPNTKLSSTFQKHSFLLQPGFGHEHHGDQQAGMPVRLLEVPVPSFRPRSENTASRENETSITEGEDNDPSLMTGEDFHVTQYHTSPRGLYRGLYTAVNKALLQTSGLCKYELQKSIGVLLARNGLT
jgi:hypothetical protein